MDANAYLTFLAIGVLMVVADGQIIYRSGRRYLEESYGDAAASASMTRLITVLFHLAVLGVLALISTIDFGAAGSIQTVVAKVGVMLLVLALAHAVTIGVLARLRDDQVAENFTANTPGQAPATGARSQSAQQRGPVTTPVPGQRGRDPRVSPSLEDTSTNE